MQALVLEDFGRMVVKELPSPVAGPGEVLIEIVATGICGSDLHGYTGHNGRRVPGQVMGHESVGRIASIGEGVDPSEFAVGEVATFNPVLVPDDELTAFAGREQHAPGKKVIGVAHEIVASFAQLIAVPARNVVVLPDDMPIAYGALIEPLAVGLHAVRRSGLRPGDKVLVVGGGPIGQSVVLAAISEGITDLMVSEVDAGRRQLCKSLGASTIDPTAAPVVDQVLAHWGELADGTIDAVGVSGTLQDSLTATKLGGAICLVGMGSPHIDLSAYQVSTEERSVIGSFTYSAKDFRDAAAWMATSPLEAASLITREVGLADGPSAFAELAAHNATPGKVLVHLDR